MTWQMEAAGTATRFNLGIEKRDRTAIGQESIVRTARAVFAAADEANDEPTDDLLAQRMRIHEKNAWVLRSMLEV
jgi:starvation-inducible DNA-binding protein